MIYNSMVEQLKCVLRLGLSPSLAPPSIWFALTSPHIHAMPTGSCLCGEVKIEFTGEPTYTACLPPWSIWSSFADWQATRFQAYCHCIDDRKLNNTQVFQVPKANFAITAGKPKVFTKQSDHGRVCGEQISITLNCKIKCMTCIS
jgi:hypothetical protein